MDRYINATKLIVTLEGAIERAEREEPAGIEKLLAVMSMKYAKRLLEEASKRRVNVDKYVNATHIIAGINKALDSLRREDGSLPDTEDVNELLRFKRILKLAPEVPIKDYRPENAPFVTFNGKPVGLLKAYGPILLKS